MPATSPDAQHTARLDALKAITRYAGSSIPAYRERFAAASFAPGSLDDPRDFARVPLLSRAEIRRGFPEAFLPDGLSLGPMLKRGELKIVRSVAARDRLDWIADLDRDARAFQAASSVLFPGARLRRASYFPIPTAGVICVRDMPAMDLRIDPRFDPPLLRLMPPEDPAAPARREVEKLFLELESHGAEQLDVYGSYLALATMVALEEGLPLPRIAAITAGLSGLSLRHRRLLEEAWGCPVIAHHSPPELGPFMLYECAQRALHVNEDALWWEVLRISDDAPAAPGELGRLVVTTLDHRVPLIRYDTGELVELGLARCACGSRNARLGGYAGRADEVLWTERGPITSARADAVLSSIASIEQHQVRQDAGGGWTIAVRPPAGAGEELRRAVADEVEHAFGIVPKVELERIQPHPLTFEFPLVSTPLRARS